MKNLFVRIPFVLFILPIRHLFAQEGIPVGAVPPNSVTTSTALLLDRHDHIDNDDASLASSDISRGVACPSPDYFIDTDEGDEETTDCEQETNQEDDDEDPMLEEMPGIGFKAYKRADISSFYQEPPGSRVERTPSFTGQAGKFVNMSPERLDLYWDAGQGPPGNHICVSQAFGSCGTSTFPGHVFYFLYPSTKKVACSFRVHKGTSVYYCDPFSKNDANDPSAGVWHGDVQSLDTLQANGRRELYEAAKFNRAFGPLYKNFTGGSEWLANYPPKPPQHFMHRADYFGQEHYIQSVESQFRELPPQEMLRPLTVYDMRRTPAKESLNDIPLAEYREPGIMNITLKVVSVAPRILQIDNFLSEVEVEHIIALVRSKHMQRSTTGTFGDDSHVSEVRTSSTTWIQRSMSPIMDAIIKRGADVLKIDEKMFRQRFPEENLSYSPHPTGSISEDLQIVHYLQGQQYTAHHDFGYSNSGPHAPSRSINLCMYLNEGMVGGETAFPRWRNAETDQGVKAVPQKGKAMIFYMKNPDGNLDDLSQHAAMPVLEGEKWFANLWTWDPFRR